MIFYLGAHHPSWLATAGVPLFVSRRRLATRKNLPRALARWALDSGGFTELSMHGRWTVSPQAYAADVRRFQAEIGQLDWAAPQDWMCEPVMVAKTGLSVEEHQTRTIDNFLELRSIDPSLPWIPVLQGWSIMSYYHHVEEYLRRGVDLLAERLVGVGSVCRRQRLMSGGLVISGLASDGLRLHGFGFKTTGLKGHVGELVSADSMAWSLNARKNPPLEGCTHKTCANCLDYALTWRSDLLDAIREEGDPMADPGKVSR